MNNTIYKILNSIENIGYKAYVVGGYVRDLILDNVNNDVDITTDAPKDILLDLFKEYNPKCFQFDTIKFNTNEFHIDVAQMRDEVFDGNQTKIIFTSDLIKDYSRRDFTMNSIYIDKNLNYIDFNNCINDCKKLKLKFVGNPELKCQEDPTRFIRGLYLILKYDIKEYHDMFCVTLSYDDFKKCNSVVLTNLILKVLKLNKYEDFIKLLDSFNLYDELFSERPGRFDIKPMEFLNQCCYRFLNS